MNPYHLEIVTPDGLEFSGEVESLTVKTDDGDVEILKGHADLLATVATGRVRIKTADKTLYASASGGFLSVSSGEVKLVAITFELAGDIDVERAEAAKARAEDALRNAKDDRDVKLAKAKLARAMSRISVAEYK